MACTTKGLLYTVKVDSYKNISDDMFENLLLGRFVDVILICQGKSIRAHQCILSSCSKLFQSLFLSINTPWPVVTIEGISFKCLLFLLEFIYKGKLVLERNDLQALLEAGDFLKINPLIIFKNFTQKRSFVNPDSNNRQQSSGTKESGIGFNAGETEQFYDTEMSEVLGDVTVEATPSSSSSSASLTQTEESLLGLNNVDTDDLYEMETEQNGIGCNVEAEHLNDMKMSEVLGDVTVEATPSSSSSSASLTQTEENLLGFNNADPEDLYEIEMFRVRGEMSDEATPSSSSSSTSLSQEMLNDHPTAESCPENDSTFINKKQEDAFQNSYPMPKICTEPQFGEHSIEIPIESLIINNGQAKIPMPPNAFMIFANQWRRKIAINHPGESDEIISLRMKMIWGHLDISAKSPYYEAAEIAYRDHYIKFSNYQNSSKVNQIQNPFVSSCEKE